jgi:excisionase family DNA binding protein
MAATLPTLDEIEALMRRVVREELGARPAPASPTGWATPEQAAEALGTTAKTIRRWAAAGRLRATREGSRWKIDRAALPPPKAASPEEIGRAALRALPGRG